jgi:hypothetical protein
MIASRTLAAAVLVNLRSPELAALWRFSSVFVLVEVLLVSRLYFWVAASA